MPKWTSKQQEVIDYSKGNLLVSAAAGSGKTAVMIERVVSLLTSGKTSLDRVLVVTYTIAAAASMKEKLARRLEEEIALHPESEFLRTQADLLDHADISTIHAVCSRLLKRYYFETELPPDFYVPDDAQQDLLREKAMSETLEQAAKQYEDGLFPEYADVLTQFAGGRSDTNLISAVRALSHHRATCVDPDAFKEHTLALYRDKSGQAWQDYCVLLAHSLLTPVPSYLDGVAELFRGTPVEENVNKCLSFFYEVVSDALGCKTLPAMREVFGRVQPSYKKIKDRDDLNDLFLRCREKIKGRSGLFTLIAKMPDAADLSFALPAAEGLFRITENYENACRTLFLENNCVSFDMILRETLRLVQTHPALAQELRDGLDYLFVDEYQDVNPLLDKLVELLSNKENLFFVGDVKQSIYGFIDAHPELFIQKMQGNSVLPIHRVDLSNNFRSAAPILDGVNALFKTYMHETRKNEIEYDEASYLRPSPDENSPQYKPPILKDGVPEEACEFYLCPSDECDDAEALACRIEELKRSTIYDHETGSYRAVEYRDIVLLGRKKSYAERFTEAFRRHNIPYRTPQGCHAGAIDRAAGALLAFLHLLILRRDDVSLITVLASPIGCFTFSELALIRRAGGGKGVSFYDAFYAFDGDAALVAKREKFVELLDRMALLQGSMSLPDFLETLCRQTGYLYALACEENSVALLGAVERLFALARRYSEAENGTLRGFIAYAERAVSGEDHLGESAESDNAVRFMTIHKSKGLEFPVVILTGTDKSIHKNKTDETFFCDTELGAAFQTYRRDEFGACEKVPSPALDAIKLKKKYFDKAENLRLLYVALTRARSKVIFMTSRPRKQIAERCIPPCAAITGWYSSYDELAIPLLYCHPDGGSLRQFADREDNRFSLITESRWSVRFFGDEGFTLAPPEENESPRAPFDADKYLSDVQERLAWRYPYAAAVTARSKQAPSRSDVRHRPDLHRPQFADPEYTGAQKGTAVHFFMEHFDLSSPDNARAQAERLRFNDILQEEEYASIPFDAIDAFLISPLGQRLRRAESVNRERPFCLIVPFPETGDEALVQGNIDCYFFEGDTIVLLDYKTDVIRGNLDERVKHHTNQMRLYKRALESLYPGKTVEAYLYFFSVSRAVQVE